MPEYKFDVTMTCSGCSGAVTRALTKRVEKGEIDKFDVSLDTQKVVVESNSLSQDEVLEIIKKTGKAVQVSSD
ncbi:Cytosolic copper metallochaperone [Gryganskiella cystojenkinii]|nr:Cytosolic copper metallochaperone [Gryganskiella cystojenkinii]